MSNTELRKLNERQNLEYQYKRQNSKIKKAAAIVGATAGVIGSLSAIKKNSPWVLEYGKKAIKNISMSTKYIKIKNGKIFYY